LLLAGFTHTDTEETLAYMAEKIVYLRLFEDESHKMNLSVLDINGEILSVSQFTLYGDARKGRRPSYIQAAPPDQAEPLYERFNQFLQQHIGAVQTGRFGADMEVRLINDGPVTIILEKNS
jgi:D-tyrosyl-tRNA(Tyr) deacylase